MGATYDQQPKVSVDGVVCHQEQNVKQDSSSRRSSFSKEKSTLPTWIIIWFYVTAVVCTWDATFIILRPFSLPGGSLAWVWYLYKYYITLDQRYQDIGDSYVFAQSLLNYVEVFFNIVTIGMHYANSKHTVTTCFTVSVMTFWKTILYFLMLSEFCTGGMYRKGNSPVAEFFLMFIPNFVWVVVPLYVMYVLWGQLVQDDTSGAEWQKHVEATSTLLGEGEETSSGVQGFAFGLDNPEIYELKHGRACHCLEGDMAFPNGKASFANSSVQQGAHQRKGLRM